MNLEKTIGLQENGWFRREVERDSENSGVEGIQQEFQKTEVHGKVPSKIIRKFKEIGTEKLTKWIREASTFWRIKVIK